MQQIRRNDPCSCGSGKKYKKCCMDTAGVNSFFGKLFKNNKYIYGVLLAIFFLSIFLRYYGFTQSRGFTFDEGLYAELIAEQLKEDPRNYSTQTAYQIYTARGEKLPEYLNRPLFKHPPLYNYCIALSYKLFGSSHLAAVSVSILFGSLMVLIVFFLGKKLFDYRVGLLGAFFISIDPIHWACSQRIWMETTMSFFMLLAVFLFVLGQKQKHYLPLSGLSIGFALLTKYPAVLSFFIITSFAFLFNRALLKQKSFWVLCVLSFLVFSPWLIWNLKIYGNFMNPIISVHGLNATIERSWQSLSEDKWLIIGFLLLTGLFFLLRGQRSLLLGASSIDETTSKQKRMLGIICAIILVFALIIIPFMRAIVREAFVWKDTVLVGWSNPFAKGPWHFYLTRLCELSPLYLFSFFSVFLILGKNKGDKLLLLSSLWILGAFTLLGNYQSRYILPVVPFMVILSARLQILVYDQLSCTPHQEGEGRPLNLGSAKTILKIVFFGVGLYFVIKTLKACWMLAIGSDFGYF